MADSTLDATGLKCPLPVLRARKSLKSLSPGDVLIVRATDPAAERDFQAFCDETAHTFLGLEREGSGEEEVLVFRLERGEGR